MLNRPLAVVSADLVALAIPSVLFKRDSRNPFRRHCRRCGQQQDMYEVPSILGTTHVWEEMGAVVSPSCACHSHVGDVR